jgi:hypothetical protein
VRAQIKKMPDAQLDHLFFKFTNFISKNFEMVFNDKLGKHPFNYSDHYGMMLEFELAPVLEMV